MEQLGKSMDDRWDRIVRTLLDLRSEESDSLQQSLDIRVIALLEQVVRTCRVLASEGRKLSPEVAEVGEFALIVTKKHEM